MVTSETPVRWCHLSGTTLLYLYLHRDCCVLNRSLLRLVLGPQQVSQHLSTNVSLLWEASVSIKRAGIEDF